MAAINNDWLDALKGEFSKPYYKKLFETVNQEYRTHRVYPPADDIFNAFHLTPLKDVKVVILGQDPYHGEDVYKRQEQEQARTMQRREKPQEREYLPLWK